MAIPDYQSFFLPVLRMTSDGKEHSTAELRERIASELGLSPEEKSQKLPSGVQTVFANRVVWSVVYLAKAGALERIKRGVFRITDRGRELLGLNVPKLTIKHLAVYPEFVAFHKGPQKGGQDEQEEREKTETPEEQLADAYKTLRDSLATDVLEAVKKAPPSFFEEVVIDLLVRMGYGGSVEDAGKAVGKAGDGGITESSRRTNSDWTLSMYRPNVGPVPLGDRSFRPLLAAWKDFGRRKAFSLQLHRSRKMRVSTCRKLKSALY